MTPYQYGQLQYLEKYAVNYPAPNYSTGQSPLEGHQGPDHLFNAVRQKMNPNVDYTAKLQKDFKTHNDNFLAHPRHILDNSQYSTPSPIVPASTRVVRDAFKLKKPQTNRARKDSRYSAQSPLRHFYSERDANRPLRDALEQERRVSPAIDNTLNTIAQESYKLRRDPKIPVIQGPGEYSTALGPTSEVAKEVDTYLTEKGLNTLSRNQTIAKLKPELERGSALKRLQTPALSKPGAGLTAIHELEHANQDLVESYKQPLLGIELPAVLSETVHGAEALRRNKLPFDLPFFTGLMKQNPLSTANMLRDAIRHGAVKSDMKLDGLPMMNQGLGNKSVTELLNTTEGKQWLDTLARKFKGQP